MRGAERGVLAAVALGAILAPLNSTMIAVALPRIVDDFDTTVGTAGWLVTAYLLALAVVQPLAGKLGDRYGRRPFMLGGLAVFLAASIGAAAAPTLATLIGFRVAQAISGAVVFPNGAGLVRELVPAVRRARAFGMVGAALSLAAALGPPLGGLFVAAAGWRGMFLVNVPLVAMALLLVWRAVPASQAPPSRTPFDGLGALLFALVLGGAALLALESRGAGAGVVAAVTAVIVLMGACFVARELRHEEPIVQPRFFARRGFTAASVGIALSNLAFYTTLIAVPLLLERREGWGSLQTGFVLTLLSAPMVALSPLGGRFADRHGRRLPSVVGCALLAAALVPLAIEPALRLGWLCACLAAAGAGVGFSSAGMQTAAVEAVPSRDGGSAAGLYSTSRYVGSFAGSIALARLLDRASGLEGLRLVFLMSFACAALSVIAVGWIGGRRRVASLARPAGDP